MASVWLLLLGLAPFTALPAIDPDWLRGFLDSGASGVLDWRHILAAFWTGWFWQLWAGERKARALTTSTLVIGATLGIWTLAAAQTIFPPQWTTPYGWPGHALGIALGMLAANMVGKKLPNSVTSYRLKYLWRTAYSVSGVLSLLTMVPPGDVSDLLPALSDHVYRFIKAAMIWLPLGGLLGLIGMAQPARVWMLAGLATLLLVGHADLLHLSSRDWLDVFAAAPGMALGFWLGESMHRLRSRDEVTATDVTAVSQAVAVLGARSSSANSRDLPETKPSAAPRQGVGEQALQPYLRTPVDWAIGLVPMVATAYALFNFPFAAWQLGLGMLAYALVLWWQPLAWLLVVPVALPVLDLAPWSGRFFLDEFDLLMAMTLAVMILRGRPRLVLSWPPLARLAMAAFLGLALISMVIGMADLPAIDVNAFSSYWSPYNSLRVAKGILWGVVVLFLARRSCEDLDRFTRWLAVGMGLGLLAVCLAGAWERWLFSGLTDLDASYRIVGLFSSMHTGGGHIEAYMAAALPFLWLGLRTWKSALLTAPLLILATYVLIYTVSRGGALAFGAIFVILVIGSARMAWLEEKRRGQLLPILALVGAATVLIGGISGGYFQQRFTQTSEDTQTRWSHWRETLAMTDDTWSARLFGMGLGSFPRVFLERGAVGERPATYAFVASRTGRALRLGTGATLYYAQRVPIMPNTAYRVLADVRADTGQARLDVPICEKQMLDSRNCVWKGFDVTGDGKWRRYEHVIHSGELGAGGVLRHLPTEFVLYNASKNGVLEIDNVQLLDAAGHNLLGNGTFEDGGDRWFFKTHSHLPWHIKNVWVHLVFEQGWLGLAAFLALTGLALTRAAKAAWRGQVLAWVFLAALIGMLSIGLFDSLLDAPRLTLLLMAFSLLAVAPPWSGRRSLAKKRRRRRRVE